MEKNELNSYCYHFLLNSTLQPKSIYPVKNAIARAHRDVLTGRYHLPNYCDFSKTDSPKEYLEELINKTKLINQNNEPISSIELIDILQKKYPSIEFGALQKLVNMTLKYLYLLSLDTPSTDLSEYCIDIKKYDCPIDSKILSLLEKSHTPWTRIQKEEYIIVQKEIKEYLEEKNKTIESNLLFDLIYY